MTKYFVARKPDRDQRAEYEAVAPIEANNIETAYLMARAQIRETTENSQFDVFDEGIASLTWTNFEPTVPSVDRYLPPRYPLAIEFWVVGIRDGALVDDRYRIWDEALET